MSNQTQETKLDQTPIKLLHPDAKLPVYGSDLAAGCDIHVIEGATVHPDEVVGYRLQPIEGVELNKEDPSTYTLEECSFNDPRVFKLGIKRKPVILRTGVAIQLEEDEELEVRGRSGLGFNYDILPFNGTVDADFIGEIKVKVWNLGNTPFTIEPGMRLAQGVIKKVLQKDFIETDELKKTKRGEDGFASTGLK